MYTIGFNLNHESSQRHKELMHLPEQQSVVALQAYPPDIIAELLRGLLFPAASIAAIANVVGALNEIVTVDANIF